MAAVMLDRAGHVSGWPQKAARASHQMITGHASRGRRTGQSLRCCFQSFFLLFFFPLFLCVFLPYLLFFFHWLPINPQVFRAGYRHIYAFDVRWYFLENSNVLVLCGAPLLFCHGPWESALRQGSLHWALPCSRAQICSAVAEWPLKGFPCPACPHWNGEHV